MCGYMTKEDKEEWYQKNRQAQIDSAEAWKQLTARGPSGSAKHATPNTVNIRDATSKCERDE